MSGGTKEPQSPQPPWSRRNFVQISAGTTLSGCSRSSPLKSGAIEIREVGQRIAHVHKVRKAYDPAGGPSLRRRCQVAIVGAGAAGLCVAWALEKRGIRDVVLVELESEIGGTARGGQNAHSRYPLGAHYLPAPSAAFPALRQLLRDISWVTGTDRHGNDQYRPNIICAYPQERHFYRGFWYEGLYPASGQNQKEADQLRAFVDHLEELSARRDAQGRPFFRIPGHKSHPSLQKLDHISAHDYLMQRGWNSWRLHWFVDYACRDDYGLRSTECSAFAAMHHFLGRGYKNYEDSRLLTAAEGNARLLADLAAFLGLTQASVQATTQGPGQAPTQAPARTFDPQQRLWLNSMVRGLDAQRGELQLEITPEALSPRSKDPQSAKRALLQADLIFWAAPRFVLSKLLRDDRTKNPAMSPWVVCSLDLRRLPAGPGAPLAWDNVAIQGDHLGYVVAAHGQGREIQNTQGTITLYQPILSKDEELRESRAWLASRTVAELAQQSIAHLEGMHPKIGAQIRRVDVARWGHAMVRPTPGRLFSPSAHAPRQAVGKIIPCGTDLAGLPIFEEAFYGAIDAVDAAFGRGTI